MATPATDIQGNFCAIYPSYVTSQNLLPAYYFAKSIDKGATFHYSTVYAAIPAAADTNPKNRYLLLTSPIDSNKAAFLLPSAQSGDPDIVAINSTDGGQTWSSPVRTNDGALANGKAQDMVWGAYNGQGDLVVTWRDRRQSAANGFWNAGYGFYYATSTDNGASFSANNLLSSQFIAFDSVLTQSGNDFMSCAYHGDTLCTLWGDTRNGKMNIYFAKTITSTNTSVEIAVLNDETNFLTLFPNPAENTVSVSVSEALVGNELLVFAATGQKVLSTRLESAVGQINTSDWQKGIYFMKIGSRIQRFVKR